MKRAAFSLLFLGIWGTSVARAEEPDVDPRPAAERLTQWEAPPTCIALSELRVRVEAQMMSEPNVVREVRGSMLRGPAGWIASFTVYDADRRLGERILELSEEECRTHDETLALVIALLLEHGPPPPEGGEILEEEPRKAEPSNADKVNENELKAAQKAEEPSAHERAPLVRFRSGIGFQAISGWLPAVAFGPTAFLGAEIFERGSVELVGDYYLAKESRSVEGGSAKTSGGRGHLRGCGLPQFGRWGAAACFGLGWMAIAASGQRTLRPESALHRSFETSASLGLTYRFTPYLHLQGALQGTAPFRRAHFVFESDSGEREVHRTSPVIFASYVGVVLTLDR